MKLPAIIAADLHLTSNPQHEYRWGLLPWLLKQVQEEKAATLILLGDLTDAKDYHPALLVNRLVHEVNLLRHHCRVVIVRGNHDYLKGGPLNTFFEFLKVLPNVDVYTKPTEDPELSELTMFLPFERDPATAWAGMDFAHYRYVFMHQTIKGAKTSNGQVMDNDLTLDKLLRMGVGKVYSGDIHVPQVIGCVEYIGSPYHVTFGDKFEPRCIVLEARTHKAVDLHYPSPARVMLTGTQKDIQLDMLFTNPGDHVKFRLELAEADKHTWKQQKTELMTFAENGKLIVQGFELRIKRAAKRAAPGDRPVTLFDPASALYGFVEADGLGGDLLDVGLELIEGD